MKNKIKNIILTILIIIVAVGILFMLVNAIRSIGYNKNAKNPIVTLDVEGYGKIKIELYPEYAPNTVKSIIKLVQNGYYNGKVFYGSDETTVNAAMDLVDSTSEEKDDDGNVISSTTKKVAEEDLLRVSDFDKSVTPYIKADDGTETGSETEDYKVSITGEFVANGFNNNTLRFEYGTVGLYRNDYSQYIDGLTTESYNSGRGMFFIETTTDSTLNGHYAAFGKVIEGMDIIEQIKNLPKEENDEAGSNAIQKFAEGSYPVNCNS